METYKLGEMEGRLAELIWDHAPVSTRKLVELCGEAFDWKRTTTYTMLKRLCQREIFAAEDGMVTVRMTREEFQGARGEQFVEETFGGSLPKFLAAFAQRRALSREEIREIQEIIENYDEEKGE